MDSWNNRAARTLDMALGNLGTWLVLVLVSVASAVVAGVATHWARPGPSAWAVGLSLGLLALTLLAILWYSFETRKLVRIQREAAEIESHPWLHVAGWPTARQLSIEERMFSGDQAALPIMNVGRTPALLTKISVAHDGSPGLDGALVELGGDNNPRVLAPGQQFLATIVAIKTREPIKARELSPRLHLSVTIDYRALQGGGGQVVVRLRYAGGVWKSRRTTYMATLASGQTLPAPASDEAEDVSQADES